MPRPDPTRLDPATYPVTVTIQTRFQDLDVLGHINNVAMAALFESGRVRFNQAIKLHGWAGHRWLVARVEMLGVWRCPLGLRRLLEAERESLRADVGRAGALLATHPGVECPAGIPPEELAAWYAVATAILNLHETITKG
jgi:hypothetical protein